MRTGLAYSPITMPIRTLQVLLILLISSFVNAADEIPAYATEPIAIDGNLDKDVWKKAEKIPISYEYMTQNAGVSKEATGYYMVAWDAHYLYIAYDWTSPTKPKSGSGGDERGPKDNLRRTVLLAWDGKQYDCFEFFVDINNDDEHFWEIHHNDRNNCADYFCIRPRSPDDKLRNFMDAPNNPVLWLWSFYIRDDGEYKFKTALREKITKDGEKEVYGGYSAELRLPLLGLGADRAKRGKDGYALEGGTLRMFAAEARANKSPCYFHSMKGVQNGWFHERLNDGQHFIFKK
jgi:hypothetical protein